MTGSEPIVIKEYDKPIPSNVDKLQNFLGELTQVTGAQHRISETFVSMFLQNFGDFPLTTNENLNKSNWTHHVYFSIRSTAKTLFLSCIFETMGRLDAVIETLDSYPGVVLVAEWENEASSIFGKHNELEKLWNGTSQHESADAFLLTYCPIDSLFEFTKRVVEFWQNQQNSREVYPSLFLVVIAYKQEKRNNNFVFIRTQEITRTNLYLWHDLGLVTSNEYLESVLKL